MHNSGHFGPYHRALHGFIQGGRCKVTGSLDKLHIRGVEVKILHKRLEIHRIEWLHVDDTKTKNIDPIHKRLLTILIAIKNTPNLRPNISESHIGHKITNISII